MLSTPAVSITPQDD